MKREVTLDLGSLKLTEKAVSRVYHGIVELAEHEPHLVRSIAFDGKSLRLKGVADSGEKVLASLGSYLENDKLRAALATVLEPTPV